MSGRSLKRGTAVIWTKVGEKRVSTKMVMGVATALVDERWVTIEIIDPDNNDTVNVTVPKDQVRNF